MPRQKYSLNHPRKHELGVPRTVQENPTKQARTQTQRPPADVSFAHSDPHGRPPFAHLYNILQCIVDIVTSAKHNIVKSVRCKALAVSHARADSLIELDLNGFALIRSVSGMFGRILGMDHEDSNYKVQTPRFQFPVPQSLCSCAKWRTLHW